MLAQGWREIAPLNLRHRSEAKSRIAEGHAGQFLFKFFAFGGVSRLREAIGQGEKALFFRFFGGEADLNQFDEDSIGAGLFGFGEGFDPPRDARWKRHALADGFVCMRHKSILHRFAPECTGTHDADDYASGASPTLK